MDITSLQKRLCYLYARIGKGEKTLEILQKLNAVEDIQLQTTKARALIFTGKFNDAQQIYQDVIILWLFFFSSDFLDRKRLAVKEFSHHSSFVL